MPRCHRRPWRATATRAVPRRAGSWARTREMRCSAASAADRRKDRITPTTVRTTSRVIAAPPRSPTPRGRRDWLGQAPFRPLVARKVRRSLALRTEHLLLLLGLGVVVAEEVEDAVCREEEQAPPRWRGRRSPPASPRRWGRARCRRARPPRGRRRRDPAAGSSIGKAHDVGGPREVHPLHVEGLHGCLVDEAQAEVGLRVDLHLAHDVAGAGDEPRASSRA